MNARLLSAAFLFSCVSAAPAEVEVTMAKLRGIGLLPQDKAELRPEDKLDIKRRNPFAERKKATQNKPIEQVETEESKLRSFFDKEKVNGIMKFDGKHVVTLGRLSLEEGQIIRPIIPNQTQILRVMKVTDDELEIGWVEDATLGLEPAVPRKIQKRINLRPEVKALPLGVEEVDGKAEMYSQDAGGKVIVPQKGVFPNPSDILESIPPGSDTNPVSALSPQERNALTNADEGDRTGNPGAAEPAPAVPDGLPSADPPAPPPSDPEDAVQPDPDLADPASQTQPAGPPGNR
jgi:hypothetical protein